MTVKLSAALPKRHGLDSIAENLLHDDGGCVVIAVVSCKSSTTDYDTGETVPLARIEHIEACHGLLEVDAMRLLHQARKQRLDRVGNTLPYDEATGELLDNQPT